MFYEYYHITKDSEMESDNFLLGFLSNKVHKRFLLKLKPSIFGQNYNLVFCDFPAPVPLYLLLA